MGHLLILIWTIVHVHSKPNTFNFLGLSNFTIFYQTYVSILFWKGKHYKRYKSICINCLYFSYCSLVHLYIRKAKNIHIFFWYVVLLIIRNKRKTMCNDILSSITSVVLYVHFCIFQFFHLHTYYFFLWFEMYGRQFVLFLFMH